MDIKSMAGKFQTITYKKVCKVLKNCPFEITKITTANTVRVGCQYDNLKRVAEKRLNGELPSHNAGLRGMRWVEYPYLLESEKTGEKYLRIELCKNSKFTSTYYVDGKKIDKNEIEDYLASSEKRKGDLPDIMNIKLSNILA